MWPAARKRCAISRAVFSIGNIFIRWGRFTEPPAYTLLARAIEVNRPTSYRLRRRFLLSKRVNDKENNGDADTGIGHVERRPRMRERHMQIEQQKIDQVPVQQSVSQIPENT